MSSSNHAGEKRRLTYDTEGDSEQDETSDVLNDLGSDDQQQVEPTREAGIGSDRTRYPAMLRVKGGEWAPSPSSTGSSTRNTFCGERRKKVP